MSRGMSRIEVEYPGEDKYMDKNHVSTQTCLRWYWRRLGRGWYSAVSGGCPDGRQEGVKEGA